MNTIKLIWSLLLATTCLSCHSQEGNTYWKIETIYAEDKTPIVGARAAFMQTIIDNQFHFRKRKDTLYFEVPQKFQLNLRQFKHLSQLNIAANGLFDMYTCVFTDNHCLIKFADTRIKSEPKHYIIEFKRLSKEEYLTSVAVVNAQKNIRQAKIDSLKSELKKQPQIRLEEAKKLPLKAHTIFNDRGTEIVLNIPEEIEVKPSRGFKQAVFGPISVSESKGRSKIYDIEHKDHDYGSKQLTIWVSTDPTPFSLTEYLSKNSNFLIVKQDEHSVVGYQIECRSDDVRSWEEVQNSVIESKMNFDAEKETPVVYAYFCLKYYKIGVSHVFIYAAVIHSQMKNFPNETVMNEILNFNYLISENISQKK